MENKTLALIVALHLVEESDESSYIVNTKTENGVEISRDDVILALYEIYNELETKES